MKILIGFLYVIQRIYIVGLLYNSAIKVNIFSWIYLIIAVIFLLKKPYTNTIKGINWAAIVILIL